MSSKGRQVLKRDMVIWSDSFQIIVADHDYLNDLIFDWTEEDLKGASRKRNAISFATCRADDINVSLEIYKSRVEVNEADFDAIVEASMALDSGKLSVLGPTDYEGDIIVDEVVSGTYQVRYLISGVDTIDEEAIEGDERYTIQMWPTDHGYYKVTKPVPQFG